MKSFRMGSSASFYVRDASHVWSLFTGLRLIHGCFEIAFRLTWGRLALGLWYGLLVERPDWRLYAPSRADYPPSLDCPIGAAHADS